MEKRKIRIVSRQSPLALLQVEEAMSLAGITDYEVIKTTSYGDRHKELSLMDEGLAADFFTRELDEALLEGRADIAVHSAKDLPYPLPDGIDLLALTEGKDSSDSLVARDGLTLDTLPAGSRIGTSSAQRKAELLNVRGDVEVVPIRGTIEERIALVDDGTVDALIVATCALDRLGLLHRATERLPFKTHPLQGKLAITGLKLRYENETATPTKRPAGYENSKLSTYDVRRRYGKVYLVGYGPGDPELITVKGQRLLQEADVVFYDDLTFVPVNGNGNKWLYVGKRSGRHSHSQEEINELMYESAIEGKTVVRLKGGDPMVFAHGREEIDYLKSRLVDVEVVPGISSAGALASLTQIPLTHRAVARSVAFVLGHSKEIQTPDADTLLYYMGGARVSEIARALTESGRSAETPAALVTNVSLPTQRTIYTTLGEMRWATFKATPVLIIVGEVVALEAKAHRPRVYDTSSTSDTPLIKITHLPFNTMNIDYSQYNYIVFTSRYGVRAFYEVNVNVPVNVKIISVGSVTTAELRKYGVEPFFESPTQSARGIIDFFRDKPRGSRILLARSDKGLRKLIDGLSQHEVTDLAVYTNTPNKEAVRQDLTQYDKIVFGSPSGVEAFRSLYTEEEINGYEGLIIAKGETTYEAIQEI
ncbi:MAG: uroporphyrinogen-III C-methyltransferase [Prevotella sp.]|nr:uroporphyrinogen-III C-methyltransferase [Prevotella sp.]